mgnify:CR=1 FL=1
MKVRFFSIKITHILSIRIFCLDSHDGLYIAVFYINCASENMNVEGIPNCLYIDLCM